MLDGFDLLPIERYLAKTLRLSSFCSTTMFIASVGLGNSQPKAPLGRKQLILAQRAEDGQSLQQFHHFDGT